MKIGVTANVHHIVLMYQKKVVSINYPQLKSERNTYVYYPLLYYIHDVTVSCRQTTKRLNV